MKRLVSEFYTMKSCAFTLVVLLFSATNAARILGIVPTPSYSHQIPFQPIFRELSRRGHQVTVITANPQNDPFLTNLTEIDLSFTYDIMTNINFPETVNKGFAFVISSLVELNMLILENTLSHPEVQSIIRNKSEHFDLVMYENVFGLPVFSERFGCPSIAMSSMDVHNTIYEAIGNPTHSVLHPDLNLNVNVPSTNLTFWDRLLSLVFDYFITVFRNYILVFHVPQILEKHFGPNTTSIFEIEKNISLLFVNTNLVLHTIRPLLPNVVRIGSGLHLKEPKPLPKDLKSLLDGAQRGVIYCSFGSNVKSKDLKLDTQKILLETFAKLPYVVLWKFEASPLVKVPENVITSKWFPQQDVLGHPNVVVFITQGGLQSIEEAIHHAVPLIGVPFMGDQPRNVNTMVSKGIALSLDYKKLTHETLNDAIVEVIENPRYREQIDKISQLIKDEPMTGLEKAVWWTEYVIRHKGAPHLRSLQIPFYQYYLLDVIGFCVIVALGVVYCAVKIIKFVACIFKYFLRTQKVKTQ